VANFPGSGQGDKGGKSQHSSGCGYIIPQSRSTGLHNLFAARTNGCQEILPHPLVFSIARPCCSRSSSNSVRTFAQVPSRRQRRKRVYMLCQGAVAFRDVPPGRAGVEAPEDAVEDASVIFQGPTATAVMPRLGQERRESLPCSNYDYCPSQVAGPQDFFL
jgi:hypothetical protein